jgi:hypothetical protein
MYSIRVEAGVRGSLKKLLIFSWVLLGWGDGGDDRVVVEESGEGDSKTFSTISITRRCGRTKEVFVLAQINFHRYF